MSEKPELDPLPPPPQSESKKTFLAESFQEFKDAIDCFYIKKNLSGRLNFAKKWPDAAAYICGERLMESDTQGGGDKTLKKKLEDEAENRRASLESFLDHIEEHTVENGVVNIDFVKRAVLEYGLPLGRYFYAESLLSKIPGLDKPKEKGAGSKKKTKKSKKDEAPAKVAVSSDPTAVPSPESLSDPEPQGLNVPAPKESDFEESSEKAPEPKPEAKPERDPDRVPVLEDVDQEKPQDSAVKPEALEDVMNSGSKVASQKTAFQEEPKPKSDVPPLPDVSEPAAKGPGLPAPVPEDVKPVESKPDVSEPSAPVPPPVVKPAFSLKEMFNTLASQTNEQTTEKV